MRAAIIAVVVLVLTAFEVAAQETVMTACTLSTFLQARSTIRESTATFEQERYIHYLKEPVFSSGQLRYVAPSRLEMAIESPNLESFIYEDGTLTIKSDSHVSRQIAVDANVALTALFISLVGTLNGNEAILSGTFDVEFISNDCRWRLKLVPKLARMREKVTEIHLSGTGRQIELVEILQGNGDRSLLTIGELE